MDPQQLRAEIGKMGDALLNDTLQREDAEGQYIPFEAHIDSRRNYLPSHLFRALGVSGTLLAMCRLILLPLDVLCLFFRYGLLVPATVCWWLERSAARLLGRGFFCPLCSHQMLDPLVYCPSCRCVQPRLRPSSDSLVRRYCENSECGKKTRWLLPGQFFVHRPQHLACRDSEHFSGCYRPFALPELAGKYSSRHIAIIGTTVEAKLAVTAYLFRLLTETDVRHVGRFEPAWELSELELRLLNALAEGGFPCDHAGAAEFDQPGERYSLSLSFILRRRYGRRLLVFHNVANAWLEDTVALARTGRNWNMIDRVILVLDPERMGKFDDLPQSEIYSRLLRVIEEYCMLPAGAAMKLRVAVVVPMFERAIQPIKDGPASNEVKEWIRNQDPALYALLVHTLHPDQLRFFAGTIPNRPDLNRVKWLQEVLMWLA